MTATDPSDTNQPARDASSVAGGSLLAALSENAAEGSLASRLERFCDVAFAHLASTGVSWLGFYRVDPDGDSMTLLACRDRPACSPIGMHGVCGQAARTGRTRIVADVLALGDDYVACDPRDRSEIVIPVRGDDAGDLVLDLDSFTPGRFSDADDAVLRAALDAARFEPIMLGPPLIGPWIETD